MLEHLGESDAARRIVKAVAEQTDDMSNPDIPTSNEQLSTTAVGDAIAERL
jgi:isocitrate/isopropylmalate dehydrogenase